MLIFQQGFSQNDTLSVEEKVHQIYENLDLTEIQSGILLDKGLSFIELDQYDGDSGRDSVYIFRQVGEYAYAGIQSCRVGYNIALHPQTNSKKLTK